MVGIIDYTGSVVARYSYDAWGKQYAVTNGAGVAQPTSNSSFIGHVNPIRYRGYYYDTETGLYYCLSRYYDPNVGRFINADDVIDARSIQTMNMFVYCANNPVMNVDPSGHFVVVILGTAIAVGTLQVASYAIAGIIVIGVVGVTYQALDHYKPQINLPNLKNPKSNNESGNKRSPIPTSPSPKIRPKNSSDQGAFSIVEIVGGNWTVRAVVVKNRITTEILGFHLSQNFLSNGLLKNIKWGVYTPSQEDAIWVCEMLKSNMWASGYFSEKDASVKSGHYQHYHVDGRVFLETYQHFHIWYGYPK